MCAAFVLALQRDFLTVMIGGLHKLTDSEEENENKNGRQGERKMRATESEREKKSHSGEATVDQVRFFSFSGCLLLSSILSRPGLSIHGPWLVV